MTTFTEGLHPCESLVSEANGERSREAVIIAGNVTPCMVLGRVTASGDYVTLTPAASDGSEAADGISYGAYDGSSADVSGVAFVRDCEHAADIVDFGSANTAQIATATTQLAALGIILR